MGPWESRILECIPDVGPWEPWILKGILDVGPWKPRILKCMLDIGPWEPRILKCILDAGPWEPRILNCTLDAGLWGSWTLFFGHGTCLEKIVNVRLSWFLEHHGVFTNAQCGFRKHRSSVDHILALDTEIRASFSQKKHLGAIFFDIEAAYDTTGGELSKREGVLFH